MTEFSGIMPYRQISDGVYLIDEFGGTNCYLVLGDEGALLIDCGTGVGDFNKTVREITALPLTVAATHGHVDHIGGAGQFPRVYVHKDDCRFGNKIQTTMLLRKLFTALNGEMKKQGITSKNVIKGKYKPCLVPFGENAVFDLGGKTLTVKHTPGHTYGSVAFIDEKDGIIFSGDNVCDALWMMLPGATSIEEWLDGAKWLLEESKKFAVYWGHRNPKLESEYISQVITWGKELLEKNKRNSFIGRIKQYPAQKDGIIYKTNKIFKKG